MALDGLERKVLSVMAVVSLLILAASAVAYASGVGLGGTDAAVEGDAADRAEAEPTTPIELPPWGEPVVFLVVSSLLGLLAGYLLPGVFREEGRA